VWFVPFVAKFPGSPVSWRAFAVSLLLEYIFFLIKNCPGCEAGNGQKNMIYQKNLKPRQPGAEFAFPV
jgi:hypothetical protein